MPDTIINLEKLSSRRPVSRLFSILDDGTFNSSMLSQLRIYKPPLLVTTL